MKTYKLLSVVLVFALIFTSCSKFVDGYDVSPNSPESATEAALLSASEVGLFAIYGGGQLARSASIMVQHTTGTSDQMVDVTRYNILEGDNINEWEAIYADILINTKTLISKSEGKNNHYAGIGKVIEAFAIGVATDFWGDIPFSDAVNGLNGEDAFNPTYDTQEEIITSIQVMLDEAIVLLSSSDNVITPGSDDFIHGGDADAWIKTAYMLKARYAQRISKKASYNADNVLSYINSAGLTGVADDANCFFTDKGNELNQWYAFQNDRGYMRMCETFVAPLREAGDPRLPFYADTTGMGTDDIYGTVYGGLETSTSMFGTHFASKSSPIPLVSYIEMKFIEAEVKFNKQDPAGAAAAYNEAVIASVEHVTGAAIPQEFLDSHASETEATITLEKIMTQKYNALVGQIEVYADWRRTEIPSLTPYEGASAIPKRLPTPLSERLYNTNAVVVSDIFAHVWWGE